MDSQNIHVEFEDSIIRFNEYSLHAKRGELLYRDAPVKIEPQLLAFLLLLIRQKQDSEQPIVTREIMINEIWQGKMVSDDAIRAVVKKLREVLGDDARKPTYVRTIPTKGYLLVCDVSIESTGPLLWKKRLVKYGSFAASVVVGTILIQSIYMWLNSDPDVEIRQASISKIASNIGIGVSTNLHNDHLITFLDRPLSENSLQLYVKNVLSDQVRRLSWGQQNNVTARWNNQADKVFITRFIDTEKIEYSILHISEAEITILQESTNKFNALLSEDALYEVIAWSKDGEELFILKKFPNSLDGAGSINRFNINTAEMTQVLVLDNDTQNVIDMNEAGTGGVIGLIYQSSNNKTPNLLIYDEQKAKVIKDFSLPVKAASVIWSDDSTRLSFGDGFGGVWSYRLAEDKLVQWSGLVGKVKDVIADCGNGCFVFTEHNGDYLDVVEVPLPFSQPNFMSTQIITSEKVDFLPTYNAKGDIYFVSTQGNQTVINFLSSGQDLREIFELPTSGNISSLAINSTGTALIGEIEKQIFLYRLDTKVFSFVTSVKDNASFPNWLSSGEGFTYIAEHKSDAGNGVATKLFHYELDSSSKRTLIEDYIGAQALNKGRYLLISRQGSLSITTGASINDAFSADGIKNAVPIKEYSLDFPRTNRWKVIDDNLYYSNQQNGIMHINKLDLNDVTHQSVSTNNRANQLEFDISRDLSKLLLVKNKETQHNLIKAEGLWIE